MGSRPVQHPKELKTYVKKAICDGKRFTTFSRLLVPAEADNTVKELICTISRRDGNVQDFLFLCWNFDLRHVTGEVAKNTAELCSEAQVSTAATATKLSLFLRSSQNK